MTPAELRLILLLTDIIITAGQSLQRVNEMSEEEVDAAIVEAEAASEALMARLRSHEEPGPVGPARLGGFGGPDETGGGTTG